MFNLPSNILIARDGVVEMAWQGDRPEMLAEMEARLEARCLPGGEKHRPAGGGPDNRGASATQ